jgi:hypothetical protein
MFRIPSRLVLVIGVALGLSLAVALWASGTSTPVGFARTDVKLEAKDKVTPASPHPLKLTSPQPLTLRSLTSAHAVEVHPYVAMPDTEDTHSLRVESK